MARMRIQEIGRYYYPARRLGTLDRDEGDRSHSFRWLDDVSLFILLNLSHTHFLYCPTPYRKYIPIDVTKLDIHDEGLPCQKAFVNVYSTSIHDPHACACCRDLLETNYDSNPMICIPPVSKDDWRWYCLFFMSIV